MVPTLLSWHAHCHTHRTVAVVPTFHQACDQVLIWHCSASQLNTWRDILRETFLPCGYCAVNKVLDVLCSAHASVPNMRPQLVQLFTQYNRNAKADCKRQQQVQHEMQQFKAEHNVKLKALKAHHEARLMTVLCCLQLAGPSKPYLSQPIVHRIAKLSHCKVG